MRIAGIVRDSVVDGVGVRDVIFVQGCSHHCHDCHNPTTWNPCGGEERSIYDLLAELKDSENNITISGGEPLEQMEDLVDLVTNISLHTDKSIWLYTGYTFDEIQSHVWWDLWMRGVEVVVDGQFEADKKDTDLRFRGSSNQRLIDLDKTFMNKKLTLWEEEE